MKEYDVYLFDMDGTLVNSEPLKGQALAMACKEYGADVDHRVYTAVMGESWQVVTGHFFKCASINPDFAEFNGRFRKHYEKLLSDNVTLNPGAFDYIAKLNAKGKRCAVVSSAATWMVDQILESLELSHSFEVVITQEHVSQHKPHPEAYHLALSKLQVSPNDALVFEDSSAGVQAGVAAGCDVVAVCHGFNGNNDLSAAMHTICGYDELMA